MKTIYNKEQSYKEALKAPLFDNNLKNYNRQKNEGLTKNIHDKEDKFLIDDVFIEDKFYNFRRFCRINKYKELRDLNKNVIEEFKTVRGVGKGKVESVLKRLENIYSDKNYINDKFYNLSNLNFFNKDQEIIHVFWQIKYSKFREFCDKKNIKYIGEINNNVLKEFKNIRGVGEGKINDIVNTLKSYEIKNSYENNDVFTVGSIYRSIKDLSVEKLFEIFNIKCSVKDILVKELEGKNIKDIDINKEELKKLLIKINSLKSPKEIIKDFEMSADERIKDILYLRYYKNKTLQDIANKYNLTRERVRQLIIMAINNLKSILVTEDFNISVRIYNNYKECIDYKSIINMIGKDRSYIINILIKEEIVSFYKEIGIIYFK